MTLLEIAEHLCNTKQNLYDRQGGCVLRKIGEYNKSHQVVNTIHAWKQYDEMLSSTSSEQNVMFILFVNEATK